MASACDELLAAANGLALRRTANLDGIWVRPARVDREQVAEVKFKLIGIGACRLVGGRQAQARPKVCHLAGSDARLAGGACRAAPPAPRHARCVLAREKPVPTRAVEHNTKLRFNVTARPARRQAAQG